MDPEENSTSIISLPDEIILIILRYNNNYRDIVHFSMTCKRFYETVNSSNLLWKNIYKQTLPHMVEITKMFCNSDWQKEVKEYHGGRKIIFAGLIEMATLYYERVNAVLFSDVARFYIEFALNRPQNFYYTVYILHNVVRTAEKLLSPHAKRVTRPYTLTDIYYARNSLRCFFHAFLALKWSIYTAHHKRPTPLQVITFFVQWVWNEDLEAEELVESKIEELVYKVLNVLESRGLKEPSVKDGEQQRPADVATEQQVLSAITHVMYSERHIISATNTANFETLDICKVLENRCGHNIIILAIYQAVARHLGVVCELNVLPNHLFLEWSPDWLNPDGVSYVVDVTTGSLKPKGHCPFARAGPRSRFRYSPDSLLESLYMAFHRTIGYIQNWHTTNAGCLTELLKMDNADDNAYRKFLPMLYESHRSSKLPVNIPLEVKYISTIHRDLLATMFQMDSFIPPLFRKRLYQKHPSQIKYAVGMICRHTRTDYKCVIKGWDISTNPPDFSQRLSVLHSSTGPTESLQRFRRESRALGALELLGQSFPYYLVLAADQTTRHVPQDFLVDLKQPTRLRHLEEHLAKEFSHFDGFRYVPNGNKHREFPDDDAISLMYRTTSRASL